MKVDFAKIGLLGGGFFIGVFFAEIILRWNPSSQDALILDLAWNELPVDFYEQMPQKLEPGERPRTALYKHKANATGRFKALEYDVLVKSNSLGFRGEEPSEHPKILFLGDSFVFAGQVSERASFSRLLDEQNPSISILNGGVAGYGTQQALNLWKLQEKHLLVEKTVLYLFWGNDLSDNQQYLKGEVTKEQEPSVFPLAPARYSRLYGRLYLLLVEDDSRLEEKRRQLEILYDSEKRDEVLPATEIALLRFEKQCQHQRIACSLVLIPPVEAFADVEMAEEVLASIQLIIPRGMERIDLFSELQKRGGVELYFRYDPHWNAKGHQAVATILQQQKIVDR